MSALAQARDLLAQATPLKRDCGYLCQAACCREDESGQNGMPLFPGEERYYQGVDWARLNWDEAMQTMGLICNGTCPREVRPLSCRIFPMAILPGPKVRMDIRAWPVCPLMSSGKRGLAPGFVKAVSQAANILWADSSQRDFLVRLGQVIDGYEALKRGF